MILVRLTEFHFFVKSYYKLSQVSKLKNMNEKKFVHHDASVGDNLESLENKNVKERTKRDVKLLATFLRNAERVTSEKSKT